VASSMCVNAFVRSVRQKIVTSRSTYAQIPKIEKKGTTLCVLADHHRVIQEPSEQTVVIANSVSRVKDSARKLPKQEELKLIESIQKAHKALRIKSALQQRLNRKVEDQEWAKEIGNVKPETLARIEQGSQYARAKLCSAHAGLVSSQCSRVSFNGRGSVPFSDLLQEGFIGLNRAIEKYDLSKADEIKFSSYAVFWIRDAVQQATARQSRLIALPRSQQAKYRELQKAQQTLTEKLGRAPSISELAEALDVNEANIHEIKGNFERRMGSLDATFSVQKKSGSQDNGASSLSDQLVAASEGGRVEYDSTGDTQNSSPERQIESQEVMSLLEKTLKPVDLQVVKLKFGLENDGPISNKEVAEIVGLEERAVRNKVYQALKKIRIAMEEDGVNEELLQRALDNLKKDMSLG